jgi:5'(3')-deoxyribonucleotidase
MKKTILLDMDCVLTDFIPQFCTYVNLRFGINLKPEQITTWDIHAVEACARMENPRAIYDVFEIPGFWRYMPPMPGAVEFMFKLVQHQYLEKLDPIVCSNPSGGLSASEKIDYIENTFPHKTKYILTKQKHLVAADALVDDSPKNCYAWLQNNPKGVAWIPYTAHCMEELQKLPSGPESVKSRITLLGDPTKPGFYEDLLVRIDKLLATAV